MPRKKRQTILNNDAFSTKYPHLTASIRAAQRKRVFEDLLTSLQFEQIMARREIIKELDALVEDHKRGRLRWPFPHLKERCTRVATLLIVLERTMLFLEPVLRELDEPLDTAAAWDERRKRIR